MHPRRKSPLGLVPEARSKPLMNGLQTWLVFGTAATVTVTVTVGCGAAVVPSARIAPAEAVIRAAREGGASNQPEAVLHLEYAGLERAEAQRLATDANGDSAVM